MLYRKIISAAAAAILLGVLPVRAGAACAPYVSAKACLLQEMNTGAVLYSQNADVRMPSASTVKILTAAVVLEHCDPETVVTVRPEWTGIEGSSVYLTVGEELTVRDLLAGLLLSSGNDAAVALASCCAGSVEEFAVLMNETAAGCGAVNSYFPDPNGLDDQNQYTTAADLAKITAYALKNELFRQLVSSQTYSCGGRTFVNHNKLLTMTEGAKGVKTGYTSTAGRTLVSLIERGGMELICVTLDDRDDWNDHIALADWAENNFSIVNLCRAGEPFTQVPVISGTQDTVKVTAGDTFSCIIPKNGRYEPSVSLPRFVYAPVKKGQKLGSVLTPQGEIPLTAADDIAVEESQRLRFRGRIRHEIERLFG